MKNRTDIRRLLTRGGTSVLFLVTAAAAVLSAVPAAVANAATAPTTGSLHDAAVAAYTYTYPLVTMEVTRRQAVNVPVPVPGYPVAPTNQLARMQDVPDADFDGVVRANVDTLYTSMFYDVSEQPMIIGMPDLGGRFHLFQVMDAWSNVEASPGSRTLGADVGAYEFALVGPDWQGELPPGVLEYRMTTNTGWALGRIQIDGADDVDAVAALQKQITAVPLDAYGTDHRPPVNTDLHDDWPRAGEPVASYIAQLSAQEYWDLYATSASHDEVRPEDEALLSVLATYGWTPDERLDLGAMSPGDRRVWQDARTEALDAVATGFGTDPVDGWATVRDGLGDYGTDYDLRAATAYALFGANLPEDAVYSSSDVDVTGEAYDGAQTYRLHLDADEIPDVSGFWSITMYDADGFLVDNASDRYAVRGEQLVTNADGSVDIAIQSERPDGVPEANWLPSPAEGGFTLLLRAYWPSTDIVDGSWTMPGVTRVD